MREQSLAQFGPLNEHLQHLVTSESLLRPPRFLQPSNWLVHVPWLQYIVEVSKPTTVVEVGTRDGVAFANVCHTVQTLGLKARCYAVTNNAVATSVSNTSVTSTSVTNSETAGVVQASFEQFREHCAKAYSNYARILETTSERARGRFDSGSVDLLLLNVDAKQDAPKALMDAWLPTLSRRGLLWVSTDVMTSAVETQLSELRSEYPYVSFTPVSASTVKGDTASAITLFMIGSDLKGLSSDSRFAPLNYICSGMTDHERAFLTSLLSRLGAACEHALAASENNPLLQPLARQVDELSSLKAFHQQEHAKHAQEVAKLKRRAADLEHRLDEKHREIAQLTQMVLDLESTNLESTKSAASVTKPTPEHKAARSNARFATPGVGEWLSKRLKGQKRLESVQAQVKLVRQSGLFDAKWYLQQNPDVADAGAEPATHFTRFGGFERRDPSPEFSLRWYCQQYPEVTRLGVNPLVHYLKEGQRKGYKTKP